MRITNYKLYKTNEQIRQNKITEPINELSLKQICEKYMKFVDIYIYFVLL